MDKDLNIKPDTLNLIDEKMENSLELIGTGDNFLPKQNTNGSVSKINYRQMGSHKIAKFL